MKEGPLVQMIDRQRVQQAAADEAKKLVDAAALAVERLVDATKEVEETATAAAAATALSPPEEAQVSLNNHSSRGIFVGVGGSRRQKHSSTAGAIEGLRRLALPEALLDRRGR
jgi:hypothetical protein